LKLVLRSMGQVGHRSKRYPCSGRPKVEPAKQGISASRRLLHRKWSCNQKARKTRIFIRWNRISL